MNTPDKEPREDKASFSVDQFCARHSISRSHFYGMQRAGVGPRVTDLNGVRRVTREDETAWLRKMSAQTAA